MPKEQAKKEVKLSKIYITEGGNLFDDAILKKFEIPQTKQIFEDEKWGVDVIEPPYDLKKLLAWLELNVVHAACVKTKVQDSFGVGFKIKASKNKEAAQKDIDRLTDFFNKCNEAEDIITVCKKVGLDYKGCGNGYFEIARDIKAGGQAIKAIYHVNATTIRVCKDKERYVQMVNNQRVYFKRYGEERNLNKNSGLFVTGEIAPELSANEIIQVKMYSPKSVSYGVPEWLPCMFQMYGEQQAMNYNLDFFTNYGVPAYAVVLEGGELDEIAKQEIKKYFEVELKGNPHRAMVFSTPSGATLRFERLSVDTKDASFRIYHTDNRDDILMAHHVPPYRAGLVIKGQLGGSVAESTDRIYLDSVVNPRQRDFTWIINELLIWEGFEVETCEFEFEDIDVRDKQAQATIDQIYFNMGARTANDMLKAQGLEPYEGGDVYYVGGMMIPVGVPNGATALPESAPVAAGTKPEPTPEAAPAKEEKPNSTPGITPGAAPKAEAGTQGVEPNANKRANGTDAGADKGSIADQDYSKKATA